MPINPYEPPQEPGERKAEPDTLWPNSRRRRERLLFGTVRAWLWFALRALIFAGVVAAIAYLSRVRP